MHRGPTRRATASKSPPKQQIAHDEQIAPDEQISDGAATAGRRGNHRFIWGRNHSATGETSASVTG